MQFPRTTTFLQQTKKENVTPSAQDIDNLLRAIASGDISARPELINELKLALDAPLSKPGVLLLRTINSEWASVLEIQADIPVQQEFECPSQLQYAASLWPRIQQTSVILGKPFVFIANCSVLAMTPHGKNKGTGEIISRSHRLPKLTTLVSLLPD